MEETQYHSGCDRMRYNLYYFDNYGLPQVKVSMEDREQAMAMFIRHLGGRHIELTAEFDTGSVHNEIYTERV